MILDAWHPQTCLGVFLPLLLSDYISKADLSPLFEKLPDDYSKKLRLHLDKRLLILEQYKSQAPVAERTM